MEIKDVDIIKSYEVLNNDCATDDATPLANSGTQAPALLNGADLQKKSRPPQISAFTRLNQNVLDYLSDFFNKDDFTRLAATCFELRRVFLPYVQHFTWQDRSTKVASLERFKTLLTYGATGKVLITSDGSRLPPFRAELLATLGKRILALPAEDRDEACEAFKAGVAQLQGEKPSSLEQVLDAAKQGVPHLKSIEQRAIDEILAECLNCADLAAVRGLAARKGVCSPEGLAAMTWQAALGAMRRRLMSAEQACTRFRISGAQNQAKLQKEHEVYMGSQYWAISFSD